MADPTRPKSGSKTGVRGASTGKAASRPALSRKTEVRKSLPRREPLWRRTLAARGVGSAGAILLAFVLAASALIAWTREQPLIAVGRIMTDTRVVRTEFRVLDTATIESRQRSARQNTPRVYDAAPGAFEEIEASLMRLPTALADAQRLEEVAPGIREAFGLTEPELAALRTQAVAGDASQAWRGRVDALLNALAATPLLDNETYQLEQTSGSRQWIEVRLPDREPARLLKGRAVNLASAQLGSALRQTALSAGFEDPLATMIARFIARLATPTFQFNPTATASAQERAADAIEPAYVTYPVGQALSQRGERLTPATLALVLAERHAFRRDAPRAKVWTPRLASFVLASLVATGLALSVAAFCRRIRRNPLRMAAVAAMLLGALAVASAIAAESPAFVPVALAAPTAFITAILAIAYDRATALVMGALHAILVTVALDQSAAWVAPGFTGVFAAAWAFQNVRTRNDLARGGLILGGALALSVAATAALTRPVVGPLNLFQAPGLMREVLIDSSWALGAGVAIGVVTLALLPTIERVFGVITGMTLIELRDPKQPLLRELQRRAPGTYNHSIAVANIAETAAEAVGADSLHLYVGALYHDIGKMNKPDYFVENQTGGVSRHAKLSPAMSLLVIVGHVKDGVELAREAGLPRSLHHYIESHHGTTLVEYFYHQARKQAEKANADAPDEIDYRYPGPKPRTREAAILMLADAVESATRAMKEPAPARIESLVHEIARKRLEDGQFDACDLSLRDLHTIESSIIKSLTSIYHARIAYPGVRPAPADEPRPADTEPVDTASSHFQRTISQSA